MNQINTLSSSTTWVATIFFVGLMIACSWLSTAMKYGLYGGPPWYIDIGNLFHKVSILCFSLIKATAISLQNLGSCSSLEKNDWWYRSSLNNLVCVRECINFMYYSKFLISSYMKLDLIVLDDVVLDVVANTLYGLISMTTIVATTRHSRTNDLTMSKALQWAIK